MSEREGKSLNFKDAQNSFSFTSHQNEPLAQSKHLIKISTSITFCDSWRVNSLDQEETYDNFSTCAQNDDGHLNEKLLSNKVSLCNDKVFNVFFSSKGDSFFKNNLINKKYNQTNSNDSDDDLIDFVLVYNEHHDKDNEVKCKRDTYLNNLKINGLKFRIKVIDFLN
jgi:hypothetical protein